jgi:hypothetical protein
MGDAVQGVATFETVPSVNPAQIYAAGYGGDTFNHDAIVARLMEDVPGNLPQTSPFAGALPWDTVFSDAYGWNQPQYATTVMFADINGDGKADVCGRGMAGIYCALNTGNGTFGVATLWEPSASFAPSFSDADGWVQPQYGSTIMFADINRDGKADVCGRGRAGIWCELSTGTGFGPAFLAQHNFSDAEGWNQLVDYGSLRFADVTGDGKRDICGRGSLGIYCAVAK